MLKQYSVSGFLLKVLNGMSMGVIVTLVPPALIGEIAKALDLVWLQQTASITTNLLTLVIGLCVAMQFNLSAIQAGSVTIATAIGGGAIKLVSQVGDVTLPSQIIQIIGLGDVINAGITASLAVLIVLLIGERLKNYTILVLPVLVIVVAGLIGRFTLPYVSEITTLIGNAVNVFTEMQPIIMGIFIAMIFAFLITSPVSSVGVAVAIGLLGISSGVANIGATAACFGLGIAAYRVSGLGTAIAHIIGSPKLQMANLALKPKIMLPVIANAAILGAVAGFFEIQGTTISAGFGFVGMIGPLTHLNLVGWTTTNLLITLFVFVILPIVLALLFNFIFIDRLKLISEDDYKLDFE
ncbi:PTS transporter subunit IIC [Haloplasma contractile]|uniref:Membrane protein putative n=1 Tax=Haloplasma contractile SSD-17B TaxID=1033810 RepID=U2E8X0_9MOLU|nr:PTS sugar transporter subunit IIC [Haloplasma contractile]ERJ11588.1 Membrane protein putative [Haloplasma contractile SSD-17B]